MIAGEDEARAFCAKFADAAGMGRIERYVALLAEENTRQNLVSTASLAQVWQRHIADSLQLLAHVPHETEGAARAGASLWMDLGSGAGLPGLVIAMARPDMEVRLIESRKRRAEWLRTVADALGLSRCTAIADRLEDVESFPASVISARAFAPLGKLIALSTRFSTPDTVWLLPKGRSAAKELEEQASAVRAMFHVEPSATDTQAGLLIGQGRPAST